MVDGSRFLIIQVDPRPLYERCYPLQPRCSLDLYTRAPGIHGSGSPAVEDQTSFGLVDPGFFNMVIHVTRFLLSGILLGLVLHANAAPAVYEDKSQLGETNVDAKVENILVVYTDAIDVDLLTKLATQALQIRSLAGRRSTAKVESEMPSKTTVYETEDAKGGKEPYHVDIVHIENGGEASPAKVEALVKLEAHRGDSGEKVEQVKSSTDLEGEPSTVVSIDASKSEIRAKSLWRNEKGRRFNDLGRKGKQLVDADDREFLAKNFDQPDELEVKEEASEAIKPGIFLKKQLSKNQEKEENAGLLSEERNELGVKLREMVLLGDGLENCGPGRYRDQSGICQRDENFY